MNFFKKTLTALAATSLVAGVAIGGAFAASHGAKTKLRIQTHFAQESPSGQLAAEFIDNVQVMSNGEIEIEMFYSSSVVKSAETFDAAATGILDCDMTGGAYQTGKNPAFQFVGDIMGGYDDPFQQLSWLHFGGGFDAAQKLYNKYGMHLLGWWVPGQESLSSSKPLTGVADLQNWKFRSPPGMEAKIFEGLGAKPIVMDFTEIFTALESKIIDGADATNIAGNKSLGIYDIVKHATYPGFHSMPSDHLACNKTVWDGMPEHHKRIMSIAMNSLSLKTSMSFAKKNTEAAAELKAAGVTLHNWSAEERAKFRAAALAAWPEFATSDEAKALVESHSNYLKQLGLLE